MSDIMTVLGPIEPEKLGLTSMHEHIIYDVRPLIPAVTPQYLLDKIKDIMDDPITLENFNLVNTMEATNTNLVLEDEEVMAAEVTDFKETGGSAMLDVSPLGIRSDVSALRRISEQTGVHIITSTGVYFADQIPGNVPRGEELKTFMLKEIQQGIGDTEIQAGHIKIGVLDLSAKTVEDFHAVVDVVNETGVSLSVHPGFGIGNDGIAIANILLSAGMPPDRLIISHCDLVVSEFNFNRLVLDPDRWGLQLNYHRTLLDQGIILGFDVFGKTASWIGHAWPPDWMRLAALVVLLKEGFSGQIVLGADIGTKTQVKRYGGQGYTYLTKFIIPKLREVGVSEYAIRKMTIENPAKLLRF